MKNTLLNIAVLTFLVSCTSGPLDPSSTTTTTNVTTHSLAEGQFELFFTAQNGDSSSVSAMIYAHPFSNSPTVYLTALGNSVPVTNIYGYPSVSAMLHLSYLSFTNSVIPWTVSNAMGANSGTVRVPQLNSLILDGTDFTAAARASSLTLRPSMPYSNGALHSVQFSFSDGDQSVINIISNGSPYSTPAIIKTNSLLTSAIPFLPSAYRLELENQSIQRLKFPNSIGTFGEGYVGATLTLQIEPAWVFPADAEEPNGNTNTAPALSVPINGLHRTWHSNYDVDFYRITATNGQIFSIRLLPLLSSSFGNCNISWQQASNYSASTLVDTYIITNLTATVTNSGASAGNVIYFTCSSYNSNAYFLTVTSP